MDRQSRILIEMEKMATIGKASKQLASLIIEDPEIKVDELLTFIKGFIMREVKEHEAIIYLTQNN